MTTTLTTKQRKMLWSLNEMEAEVRRLRLDARLAGLDGRNAQARKYSRQADKLTRMILDRSSMSKRSMELLHEQAL